MSDKGMLREWWEGLPKAVLGRTALVLLVTFIGYVGGQWNAGLTRIETNLTESLGRVAERLDRQAERLEKLEAKVDRNGEALAYIKGRLDMLERSQPAQADPVSPASVASSVPVVHPALWSTGGYSHLFSCRSWS